jgi:hypothetical protein
MHHLRIRIDRFIFQAETLQILEVYVIFSLIQTNF